LKKKLFNLKEQYSKPNYVHEKYSAIMNPESISALDELINTHVSKGCLTDPEDSKLYVPFKKDSFKCGDR
jgi:hypothetical protein